VTYNYHSGYAELAQAILKSGVQNNDEAFLKSEWADTLRTICRMDDQMYGDRELRVTRGYIEYIGG
jgi:hypothetical protein